MSENKFNNNKKEEIFPTVINSDYKYNEENESINVTYEDIDTCKLFSIKHKFLIHVAVISSTKPTTITTTI